MPDLIRRAAAHTPALVIGLTILADYLFYDHHVGYTAGLFTALTALILLARCGRNRRTAAILALAAYTLTLAAALFLQPGRLAVALATLALVILALATRGRWIADARYWVRQVARFLTVGLAALFRDLPRLGKPTLPLLTGLRKAAAWILPALLTCGFLALFGLANPVMADTLDAARLTLIRWIDTWLVLPAWQRVLFWCAIIASAWALLRLRPSRLRPSTALPPLPDSGFPAAAIVRCLLLFNAAFALQNAMDARYLWARAELPEGLTYAGYAHRGAYPLVATALLAALFVLITFAPGRATVRHRAARGWVMAWIAQNVLLTVSAAWRLHLYVETYGLTRLRLAAALWMALVAIGLALICWRIAADGKNNWLINLNVAQLATMLTLCAFIPFDAVICWHNVRHAKETGGVGPALDVRYARTQGTDALPALRWFVANSSVDTSRWEVRVAIERLEAELAQELSDWRGWTPRRARLAEPCGSPASATLVAAH